MCSFRVFDGSGTPHKFLPKRGENETKESIHIIDPFFDNLANLKQYIAILWFISITYTHCITGYKYKNKIIHGDENEGSPHITML